LALVSIVVPVFNEEEVIEIFHENLCLAIHDLPEQFLIYYVNDGSKDKTGDFLKILASRDERIRVVELSRNFGHQAALTAGLDVAAGDWIITLDGDGQHPPELIPEMLSLGKSGYDVVITQREDEFTGSVFKRSTAALFYNLINRIGETKILPGGADFRLMSRKAVDALKQMPEYHRFLRGMVAWIGYRSVILPYTPPQRLAGKSKYSLKKMMILASDAIFSFSLVPLYIGISLGIVMLFLALIEVLYVLSFWVTGRSAELAAGWSSLMFVILVVGGILMILLGFIGIYIGFIFQEVKRRPVYFVREIFPHSPP
jgi:polyisoprenyl-phosphate glycosyltransferase